MDRRASVRPIEHHVSIEEQAMSDLTFRLMERHQQIDEALRAERRRRWPDPLAILRLTRAKLALRQRLGRLMRRRIALHG